MRAFGTKAELAAVLIALASSAAQAAQAPLEPAKATGPAINCVQLQNIRETRVRDNQTIDFIMRGGQVFRNTLPHSCPQLGFERAFSYQTSINQLCNVDIITVIVQTAGPRRGASCGLGKFTPIEPPARTK
ncbi:MAG: hypothetical protein H7268_16490 [Sandarakinorhabdus sp.]|nr:hypothetical protein [Sandarakinorhabdus sp.]